jgi:hypothetical protein
VLFYVVQEMKILQFILTMLLSFGILSAQGEKKHTENEDVPSIKQLVVNFASRDKSVAVRHITFWSYFNNDPTIQAELLSEFKTRYSDILTEAFKSSGNMHNPKVLPLRSKFAECLLKTPTITKLNEALSAHGYSVKNVEFEKFEIDKKKEATPFYAVIWLILEPVNNEEAQQAGTGQPATRPESKSEGSDKPQPEAEGRSR